MTESKAGNKKNLKLIIPIVLAVQLCLSFLLGTFLFKNNYNNAKSQTEKQVRQNAYEKTYGMTEAAYHVSNQVNISIEGIREKADLEVLAVDTKYIYIHEGNPKVWYEIPATGYFTVDLAMSEFIIDNNRMHVLAKIPDPTIKNITEDYNNVNQLLFKDGVFNGSIQQGEDLARQMYLEAHNTMLKELSLNAYYFSAAQSAAEKLIVNMIKALNPDLQSMTVDIEFV